MYIVVSKWKINPGKEDQFDEISTKMREFVRKQPCVKFVESLRCEEGQNEGIAIVGYTNKADYDKFMADGGPFETEVAKQGMEDLAEWQWSERGESMDRETANA